MPIARDANNIASGNPVTSITYALTVGGSDRLLVVGLMVFNSGATGLTASYAGTDMGAADVSQSTTGNGFKENIWIMKAPATGANNVVVSWTTSTNSTSFASSYTGVSQTETPDATNAKNDTGPTTSYTQSITTVANNSWAVWMLRKESGSAATAGTGSTLVRENASNGFHAYDNEGNGAITPAGSYTFNSSDDDVLYSGLIVSFAPAVATGYPPTLLTMNVG